MKNKLLLLSLFYLFTLSLSAQIKDEEGTIYLADAREFSGRISYFSDDPNNIVLYDKSGNRSGFTLEQIQEIRLYNGKRFFTKVYKDNSNIQYLLLQAVLLSNDKISLYKLERPDTEFFVTKGDQVYKLENNKQIFKENSSSYRGYDHQYIVTLTLLMQDRYELTQKLQKIKLQEDDLIEILTEYAEGEVSYYRGSGKKEKGQPYWSVFSQYSNFATYYWEETEKPSFGILLGFQYHFTKSGRGSIKASLDRSSYKYTNRTEKMISFSVRYQYELIQQEKFNFYANAQIFDLSWYSIDYLETSNSKGFSPLLRLSPGLGFEFKPTQRFALFCELNHVFQLEQLPQNHSFGIKYSLIK